MRVLIVGVWLSLIVACVSQVFMAWLGSPGPMWLLPIPVLGALAWCTWCWPDLYRWARRVYITRRRSAPQGTTTSTGTFHAPDGPERHDLANWSDFEQRVGRRDAACLLAEFEPKREAYDHPDVQAWVSRLAGKRRFFLQPTDDATKLPLREWIELAYGACVELNQRRPVIVEFYLQAGRLADDVDRVERIRSQRRARVSAQHKGDGSIWIVNDGPADARNVRISVEQSGLIGTESFIEGVFPIQTLSAGSRVAQRLAVRVHGRPRTADITLIWDDDGKDGREWQSNLPLF